MRFSDVSIKTTSKKNETLYEIGKVSSFIKDEVTLFLDSLNYTNNK